MNAPPLSREEKMIIAHKRGRQAAPGIFAILDNDAKVRFISTEEQDSFLAGLIMEMKRLARIRDE